MSDVLEDRLRRTFDAVAATSDEPVVTPPAPSRRPIALVAASVLVVLGLAATMFAVRSDDDPAPAAELPAWYQAIAPALPDGFDQVAVARSNDFFVDFWAIAPDTPLSLSLTVTRDPMEPDPSGAITLAEAKAGPWTDPNADLNVSLPDGRQVGVYCSTPTLTDTETPCPAFGEHEVTADEIRTLALALADLDVTVLPEPVDEAVRVPPALLNAAVRRVIELPLSQRPDAPQNAVSWVVYTETADLEAAPMLSVVALPGVVPGLSVPSTSIERDGSTITWRSMPDGSMWTVTTAESIDPAAGAQILDAGAAMTDERAAPWEGWWGWIAPALPEGFEHIAVLESNDELVAFEAFDILTGRSLYLSISRRPVAGGGRVTLDVAREQVWADVGSVRDVLLPDGRRVGATCGLLGLMDPGNCPSVGGATTDLEELRLLTLALADVPVDVLPQPDGIPSGIDILTIASRAAAGLSLPTMTEGTQGRWLSTLTFGVQEGDEPTLDIRVLHSVTPQVDDTIRSVQLTNHTITWRGMPDGSVWIVAATAAIDAASAAAILDGAFERLTNGPRPELPVLPTTVP